MKFTDKELWLLSDCILSRQKYLFEATNTLNNYLSAPMRSAIKREYERLGELNSKVCSMISEEGSD